MKNVTTTRIKIGNQDFKVIWLGKAIDENLEVYPGDPKPKKMGFSEIQKTGYEHYIWQFGEHNFLPHADAPKHQNLDMPNHGIEFYSLDYFFNKACLIDISDAKGSCTISNIKFLKKVEKKHLEPFSEIMKTKTAIVIRTGYDKWLGKNQPHQVKSIPYLAKDAVDFIFEHKTCRVFGIDSLTIDPPGKHYGHKKLKDRLIIESLVNLDLIPKIDRSNFDLQTSTVPIIGATGSPVCAFAFIGNTRSK